MMNRNKLIFFLNNLFILQKFFQAEGIQNVISVGISLSISMEVDILKANNDKLLTLEGVKPASTISEIKQLIYKHKRSIYPERQSLKLDPRGKSLSDDQQLRELDLKNGRVLYLKDLGPQVGWKTVFLWEYFGPIVAYLIPYSRPHLLYGDLANRQMHYVVHIAAACFVFHYIKRLLETLFVHRFSHATMPIMNLFKNCSYYWGFAFYIGYSINHPFYSPAYFGKLQIYGSLIAFLLFELGNFSIHIALRNLRPPGTRERKIPRPTSNPLTWLFNYVSCPNYTYEFYSWVAFSVLTQSLPAAIFSIVGFGQMAIWALGKHKQYKKEFKNYPKGRKAIIPFIL